MSFPCRIYGLFLCLMALTCLSGCMTTAGHQEAPSAPPSSVQTEVGQQDAPEPARIHPLPDENVSPEYHSSAWRLVVPTSRGGYYSVVGQALSYAPDWRDKATALCAQTGCTHADQTCRAFLGSVVSMGAYREHCYALVSREDGGYALVEDGVAGNGPREIARWSPGEDEEIQVLFGCLAWGNAYVTVEYYTYQESEFQHVLSDSKRFQISLESGTSRELPCEGSICGASDRYVVTHLLTFAEDPAATSLYESNQLLAYDLQTGTTAVIADMKTDGYRSSPDPNITYGNAVVLLRKDTLYTLDLTTLEETAHVTMPHIVNYWIMDGKVFFLTNEGSGTEDIYRVHYVDMETGRVTTMENEGNTDHMVCSIMQEGNDYFVTSPGKGMISKEDFYAENYGD